MKSFHATTTIRARPETVWGILTDASGYPSWDSTYTRIDGRIAPSEEITLHHRTLSPKVLPMKVTAFEPNQRMVWTGGGLPAAVFKGERIFTLAARDGGVVEFSLSVEFTGLMAPMIVKTIPGVRRATGCSGPRLAGANARAGRPRSSRSRCRARPAPAAGTRA